MTAVTPEGWANVGLPLNFGVSAGDYVFVSGLVATNEDGSFVTGSVEDEVNGAIDRIEEVMKAAGGSLSDVVKVTAYLSNALLFKQFNEVYATRFGPVMPARATLIVGFAHPDVRVEIEAIGYLPNR